MSKNRIEVIEAEKCIRINVKSVKNMLDIFNGLIDEGYKVTVNPIKKTTNVYREVIDHYEIEAAEVVTMEVGNE